MTDSGEQSVRVPRCACKRRKQSAVNPPGRPESGAIDGRWQQAQRSGTKRNSRVAGQLGRTQSLLWVLLVSVLSVGCAMVEKDRRALGLEAATTGYQSALRWGYYETAFGFLHPDQRKDVERPEALDGLRITGYDVVQPPVMQDDDTASQIVVIDYLFEDAQVVRRLTDRQVWRWDDQLKSWWLDSGLPRFESDPG